MSNPQPMSPTSRESYQRMLACQPGDAFHERFAHVVRVRSLAKGRVIVTEHYGTGPSQEKLSFSSKENFAKHYAYKSESMKNMSILHWEPDGFGHREELICICEPIDLLNNGCRCK